MLKKFSYTILFFLLPLLIHAQPADLQKFVTDVRQTFEVPGIAIAIVKDGEVVLTKGYGVKKIATEDAVDEHTTFAIASNSKAFTATALALLVEEGAIAWDAPVIDYLPWFRMSDPYVTEEMTVRDLLVHRSGLALGAGDLMWWPESDFTREEIARQLRYLPLETSFRSAYAYDNVLYSVAGVLIEEVTGMEWEDFIDKRILEPMDMDDTSTRHSEVIEGTNVATSHAEVEGVVRPVRPFLADNTNPAGGLNSSAADMAKWMIVQLDSGRVDEGNRLFSRKTTKELWTPVTPISVYDAPPELQPLQHDFDSYALGFRVRDYRDVKIVTHTGGLPGFVSRLTLVPDIKLGVMVLTNQESGAAFNAISNHIVDHYINAPPFDWLQGYAAFMERVSQRVSDVEERIAAERDAASGPSLPLEKYAGTYRDAWYGVITIEQEKDGLVLRFSRTPQLVGDVEHWQHDTFIVRWRDRELRADAFVTFALNPDGSIEQAKMRAVSPATDFSFDFHHLLLKPAGE